MPAVKGKGCGGVRKGAGRPRKTSRLGMPVAAEKSQGDPVEFLMSVVNDAGADASLRVRAAGLAAQYLNVKRADGGIKAERKRAADKTAAGQFGAADAPPKLVVNNR